MSGAVVHAFVLALGLIMPLGAQNTFVLTQGALHRRWVGALPTVLTAAVCDTFLVAAAVSGVSVVVLTVPWLKTGLGWVGVAFLLFMGWMTWRTKPGDPGVEAEQWPVRRQVLFAASVSLFNPHAILDTVAVIGTSALQYQGAEAVAFTLSCIAVSWLWFLGLATAGFVLGTAAVGASLRQWLNRISAAIMWGVAAKMLSGLV